MSRLLCTLLLGLLALNVSAQSLTASVDRTRLDAGESVELTLESDDATLFGKPDLQPLNELFEVLGTRQVNRLTSGSNGAQASTRWIVAAASSTWLAASCAAPKRSTRLRSSGEVSNARV